MRFATSELLESTNVMNSTRRDAFHLITSKSKETTCYKQCQSNHRIKCSSTDHHDLPAVCQGLAAHHHEVCHKVQGFPHLENQRRLQNKQV